MSNIADASWYGNANERELAFIGMEIAVGRLTKERDAALSAMWGMICVATGLRASRRAITHALSETAQELDRLRASVSLQARDGH